MAGNSRSEVIFSFTSFFFCFSTQHRVAPTSAKRPEEKTSAASLVGIGGSAGIKSPLGQELLVTRLEQ